LSYVETGLAWTQAEAVGSLGLAIVNGQQILESEVPRAVRCGGDGFMTYQLDFVICLEETTPKSAQMIPKKKGIKKTQQQ